MDSQQGAGVDVNTNVAKKFEVSGEIYNSKGLRKKLFSEYSGSYLIGEKIQKYSFN